MTKGERFAAANVRPTTGTPKAGGKAVPCVVIGWAGPVRPGEVLNHFVLPIPPELVPDFAVAELRKAVAESYDRSLIYG